MKIAIISLTRRGTELALNLGYQMKADIYAKNEFVEKYIIRDKMFLIHPVTMEFSKLIEKVFTDYDGLVFVMACGIVVRSIAPYLKDKTNDPAVVVVDEKGQNAISLLSGHIGGANKLAREVAALTGGNPIITTATDINDMIAFDVFADENDCVIENIKNLKYISSELVNGGEVSFYTDCKISGAMPSNVIEEAPEHSCKCGVVLSNRTDYGKKAENLLYIRPRNLVLGIGCKKGTSGEAIKAAVEDFMSKNRRSLLSVKYVASIDLKKNEKGILDFCGEKGIEFRTFSAEVIKSIEDRFVSSAFVKSNVGVGSVAEACAVMGGDNARLVCPKTVYKGITLALAEEERVLYI